MEPNHTIQLSPRSRTNFCVYRGMNYLHQHKPRPIIHRDLTPRYGQPSNRIMLMFLVIDMGKQIYELIC